MKTIKFARWYRKLGLRVFSTVRKAGYGVNQGEQVMIQFPDGNQLDARVLLVHERPLQDLPGEFVMADTDTASRVEAMYLLEKLKSTSRERLVYLVCVEKDPTECHRSFVKQLLNEMR